MIGAPLDATPAAFPLDIDPATHRVRLIAMGEADYRAASFLDARILPQTGEGRWADWGEIARAAHRLSGEADFIFHMGHVGSTLLSRILAVDERIFSVREPAILRTLADARVNAAARLAPILRLLARTWRPEQRALVKATSFVSDMAGPMMAEFPTARAVLMFVPPVAFVATLLAGEATRPDLRASGRIRLARLHRRLGREVWRCETLSEGELAAMAWAGEALALAEIAERFAHRSLWFNFETMLAAPGVSLARCLTWLRGAAPEPVVSAMLASPDFGRYSKSLDHAYDAGLRARILAEARRDYAVEIDRALLWLNAAGRDHPAIANAARTIAAAARS